MPDIGIIGAGVAGLHLGLLPRRHDIPVTLYSDRTPAQVAMGPLPATVAHHAPTLRREAALGVGFWPADTYGYTCHHHYVGGDRPLTFRGDFTSPSRSVDHRLFLPALTDVLQDRGGELRVGQVTAGDVERLAARHDLLVVTTGRGPPAGLFPPRDGPGTATAPHRRLCAGLFHGVAPAEPEGVTLSLAPGRGELIEMPFHSRDGRVTALLFECVPGGGADALCELDRQADPAAFDRAVRAELAAHHPTVSARTDPARFGLTGPRDLVRTAIVPTVRADWAELPGGRYALALGDAHTVVDPIVGQGANVASYSAQVLADAVLEDPVPDELFCHRVARRRREAVLGAAHWSALMLRPPAHVQRLLGAMSECGGAADEFTDNFGHPDRQWRLVATPERTRAFLTRHGASG